ncbi:NAD(P)/FAD-dependent oxidoreductase [Janibacter melonis]|uniref:NAD(P)/FAD-dependent oxidoreductase n=1 Tax=Janibacter melonis TaxID=262209 RepID=UPI00191A0204|nr:FAD-dependent oxidoreductase [Janibacter melonis]
MPDRPTEHESLAGAARRPYWTDPEVRPSPSPGESLRGEVRGDLAVVGGGFTGLWAALQAVEADPGRRVVVLEGGPLGFGASGRNGGFVSHSLTHGLAQGVGCWPEEIETLERMGAENFAGLQADVARLGIDCDLHVPGELTLALDEHQVGTLREGYQLHRQHGADVTWLDAPSARERVDSPRYRAGMLDPTVGLVDPARLLWGVAAAARERGVEVFERSPVRVMERDGSGMRLRGDEGSVRADQVVLATGAYPALLRRVGAWVIPVYDHVLMTEPLSGEQLGSLRWHGREGLTDAGNQFHYYRLTADDRILFGGYDASYHYGGRIDAELEQGASHDLLARHLLEIFPQLEGVRISHRWAGVIDTTSRFTPIFGTSHGGRVAYAMGYTGLGVASTRFGAAVALDLLSGAETERTGLSMVRDKPIPFPPEPLRYAAVQATRAAMAREDRTGRRGPLLRALDVAGVGFDS